MNSNKPVLAPDGIPIAYVSKRDAARYIGRSARWLGPRLEKIGYFKTESGRVFVALADLDRFMESFRV